MKPKVGDVGIVLKKLIIQITKITMISFSYRLLGTFGKMDAWDRRTFPKIGEIDKFDKGSLLHSTLDLLNSPSELIKRIFTTR